MDAKTRFKQYVLECESGCHEWQSTIKRDGYGQFWMDGKSVPAHRVAHTLFKGGIPDGLLVLHHCDNRKCVNPEHLYAGTAKDNVRDMHSRGRAVGRSKSTLSEANEIRALYKKGNVSQAALGGAFGLSQPTVGRIVREATYLSID